MKKSIKIVFFIFLLTSFACSSDDDSGSKGNCKSCAKGPVSIDVCDNGDGTYSVNGESDKIKYQDGETFDEVFKASCDAISAKKLN